MTTPHLFPTLPNNLPLTHNNLISRYTGTITKTYPLYYLESRTLSYEWCSETSLASQYNLKVPGNATIHEVAKFGDMTRILEMIASNPMSIHDVDSQGNTPLFYASAYGNERVTWMLSELGARDSHRRCLISAYTTKIKVILRKFNNYRQENSIKAREDEEDEEKRLGVLLGELFEYHNPQDGPRDEKIDEFEEWAPDCAIDTGMGAFKVHSWIVASRWPKFLRELVSGCSEEEITPQIHNVDKESITQGIQIVRDNIPRTKEIFQLKHDPRIVRYFLRYLYTADLGELRLNVLKEFRSDEEARKVEYFFLDSEDPPLGTFLHDELAKDCCLIKPRKKDETKANRLMVEPLQDLAIAELDDEGALILPEDHTEEDVQRAIVALATADVLLCNDTPRWRGAVHSSLICTRCPFFAPLLRDEWHPNKVDGRISFTLELPCLRTIVKCLYSNRHCLEHIPASDAVELIFAGKMLFLPSIWKSAEEAVIDNLDENVVVPLVSVSGSSELRSSCFQFLVRMLIKDPRKWEIHAEALLEAEVAPGFIENLYEKVMDNGVTIQDSTGVMERLKELKNKK